jgi:hypothetical protein
VRIKEHKYTAKCFGSQGGVQTEDIGDIFCEHTESGVKPLQYAQINMQNKLSMDDFS